MNGVRLMGNSVALVYEYLKDWLFSLYLSR